MSPAKIQQALPEWKRELAARKGVKIVERLARRIARRLNISYEDAVSLGHDSLMRATALFDPDAPDADYEKFVYQWLAKDLHTRCLREIDKRNDLHRLYCEHRQPAADRGRISLDEALSDTSEAARSRLVDYERDVSTSMLARALMPEDAVDGEAQILNAELRRLIGEAFDQIKAEAPADLGRFIRLYYEKRQDNDQIAEAFGRSLRTVRRLHEQVRSYMRRALLDWDLP